MLVLEIVFMMFFFLFLPFSLLLLYGVAWGFKQTYRMGQRHELDFEEDELKRLKRYGLGIIVTGWILNKAIRKTR